MKNKLEVKIAFYYSNYRRSKRLCFKGYLFLKMLGKITSLQFFNAVRKNSINFNFIIYYFEEFVKKIEVPRADLGTPLSALVLGEPESGNDVIAGIVTSGHVTSGPSCVIGGRNKTGND
jgi:hypothetical protein